MDTAYRDGRHRGIPINERSCICGSPEPEDLVHYILHCPLYSDPRERFVSPLIVNCFCQSPLEVVFYLLVDKDKYVTWCVALFATAAKKIRKKCIAEMAINYKGDDGI